MGRCDRWSRGSPPNWPRCRAILSPPVAGQRRLALNPTRRHGVLLRAATDAAEDASGHNTPASRQQAAAALARLYDFVTTTHNTRFTIEVLALQALLQDAQGDEQAALALLERPCLMAEPGGFIRLFADLGPRMADLLARLRRKGVAPDYTGQILQAFGDEAPAAGEGSSAAVSAHGTGGADRTLDRARA